MALLLHSIPLGELPPPPPRACFGRDELVEEVVVLAENIAPIALIGAGGIGKTSIALTVLHHNRIKKRFGSNRWFIRCDQFPASCTHFLNQLSKVIGAGIENPKDLTPLRPFLSSREMILILDNTESILDPQGTGAQDIYPLVEELSQFETVCLCITSRISTVPRHSRCPVIPTLSMDSACNIFYGIYNTGGRSDIVNNLLRELDFHALSIMLLATTASHNMWGYDRLAQEWDTHRVQVLRTNYNESLAATIDLSLASPTFCKLGPEAHDLLSVIAFFPQGIDENNLSWLFPTITDRRNIFDKFCALSLVYQNNRFITMLAPLRDHFYPQLPLSSPLLCMTKECYFSRLSVDVNPSNPGFEEAQWIISEDLNIEHLLNVFTTIDPDSDDVWDACADFMQHLVWHKPQLVVLGQKVEGLPDGHTSKPQCLFQLSQLFYSVGNDMERKRLIIHALKLWREQGDDFDLIHGLGSLSDVNRTLGLYKEGIQQAKEALEIGEQVDNVLAQAWSWRRLAWLLCDDNQLDAAEEAGSKALNLSLQEGDQLLVCKSHRLLGVIYHTKSKAEEATSHLEIALGIASSSNWHNEQFSIHCHLAQLFSEQGRFDAAHTQAEHAKSHAANNTSTLGRAIALQAWIWYDEHMLEEARFEALHAADVFEKLGVTEEFMKCRRLIQKIEEEMKKPAVSGEHLEIVPLPVPVNSVFSDHGASKILSFCKRLTPHWDRHPHSQM